MVQIPRAPSHLPKDLRVAGYRIFDAFVNQTSEALSQSVVDHFMSEVFLILDSVGAPDSFFEYELDHLYDSFFEEGNYESH